MLLKKPFPKLCWLLFLFLAASARGQDCTPVYVGEYGGSGQDEAFGVLYTPDKGSLVIGRTTTNTPGDYDAFLLKLTESGGISWSKKFGTSADDEFFKVKQALDGGYFLLGTRKTNNGDTEFPFVMKTSANGTVEWTRDLTTTAGKTRFTDLLPLPNNNLAVTLNLNDSTKDANGYILQFNPTGTLLWSQVYDGGKQDRLECLLQKKDTLLVGGQSQITGDQLTGIVLKLNISTGTLYSRTAIRKAPVKSPYIFDDDVISMHHLKDGGVMFSLLYRYADPSITLPTYNDVIHAKMSNDGQVFYAQIDFLSMESTLNQRPQAIRISSDSAITIASNSYVTGNDTRIIKTGRTGYNAMSLILSNQFSVLQFRGLDTVPGNGYLTAGFFRDGTWDTYFHNTIRVVKMNQLLNSGDCTYPIWQNHYDSTHILVQPLESTGISIGNASINADAIWNIADAVFTTKTICKSDYCLNQETLPEQCNKSFNITTKGAAGSDLSAAVRTPDGGLLSVGGYSNWHYEEPMLVRFKQNGEVIWAKQYSELLYTGYFDNIIPTKDGNYLAWGIQVMVLDNGASRYTLLTKLNGNGEILWKKKLDALYSLQISVAKEMDNGDIILIGTTGWGAPPVRNYIMRLNAAGETIWKRQISRENASLGYKYFAIDGNFLYIAADQYQNNEFITVQKFDMSSGNSVWDYRYVVSPNTVTVNEIIVKGGSLYVAFNLSRQIGWESYYNLGLLKIDKQGQNIGSIIFPEPLIMPITQNEKHSLTRFIETSDGNFAFAGQTKKDGLLAFHVFKFKPNGELIWSKKFPQLKHYLVSTMKNDGDNILLTGSLEFNSPIGDMSNDRSFLVSLLPNGEILENANGECGSLNAEFSTQAFEGFTNLSFGDNKAIYENGDYIKESNPDLAILPAKVVSSVKCQSVDYCTSINLSGETTICDPDKVYTYNLTKDPNCTAVPVLLYDSTAMERLDVNGEKLQFRFRKSGRHQVKARIFSGCKLVETSLDIQVNAFSDAFSFGPDTTICSGIPLLLKAPEGLTQYQWQDGSSLSTFTASATGKYFVTASDGCGNQLADTIQLQFPDLKPIQLGTDTSFCEGTSFVLDAGNGFSSYTWSNGVQTQKLNITQPGTYAVTALHSSGCKLSDTILINAIYPNPRPKIPAAILCDTETTTLKVNETYNSYLWNTGATSREIVIGETGSYWILVIDIHGCSGADTIYLMDRIIPEKDFVPAQMEICNGSEFTLSTSKSFNRYAWSTGESTRTIQVNRPGTYTVSVTDGNGCTSADSTLITVVDCLSGVFFPTAFTPNGDRKNDSFKALVYGRLVQFRLTIFNRFGEKVFESTDPSKGWDGTIRGMKNDSNAFVWTCSYQIEGQSPLNSKGIVLLVR